MGHNDQFALQNIEAADVRFGSKADIEARPFDVRFTPKSGHQAFSGDLAGFLLLALARNEQKEISGTGRKRKTSI